LKKQKEFSFDRNSSSPLEHMFGITRGRIKDAQTCSKFVKSIAKFQLFEKEYDDIKIEQRIPGKKKSFGVFVSSQESDDELIDFEQVFETTEYSPRNITSSMLKLAGFDDLPGVTDDEANWFYFIVRSIMNEYSTDKIKSKHKCTNKVSYAHITLGVDGGGRAKSLLRDQSASLSDIKSTKEEKMSFEDRNIKALNKLIKDKLNRYPEKNDLSSICQQIKLFEPSCPVIPENKSSFEEFINCFAKNFKDYEVMINSFKPT